MEKQRRYFYTGTLYFVLITGLVLFLVMAVQMKTPNLGFDNEALYQADGEWTVSCRGTSITSKLPLRMEAMPGDRVVYETVLEKPGEDCNSLMFYSMHQYIQVYLDEEMIYSYGEDIELPFSMSVPSGWRIVRLPQDWAGKKLKIEQTVVFEKYGGYLEEVFLGTKNTFTFAVIKRAMPTILISIPVFVMGALLVVASFLMRQNKAADKVQNLGFLAIVISSWIFSEGRCSQLIFHKPLGGSLVFLLFGMIPVLLLRFLLTYKEFEENRWVKLLYVGSLLNYIMIHVLQMMGIRDYLETVTGSHAILMLTAVAAGGTYFHHKAKGLPLEDTSIYYACFTFAFFGLLDIVKFYIFLPAVDAAFFTRIGIVFFIGILTVASIRTASREHVQSLEKKTLEKLAYTDMLTGLHNRTAFEKRMEKQRDKNCTKRPLLLVADVNCLKAINDTMGHACGDMAIMYTANCLKSAFENKAECFRIGGDEFCVIGDGLSEEAASGCAKQFTSLIEKAEEEIGFGFQVAWGCKKTGALNPDDTFIEADRRMYEQKARMKEEKSKKEN